MISNMLRWLKNIWKLREIFDKYLPEIRAHREALIEADATIRKLRAELESIKAQKESAIVASYKNPVDTTVYCDGVSCKIVEGKED